MFTQFIPSLGLMILLITILAELALAIIVLRSNPHSATGIIFSVLSVVTALWLAASYVVNLPGLYFDAVFLARLGIFFAAPMSSFLFLLAYNIPDVKLRMHKWIFGLVLFATAVMMALNISPYAFTKSTEIVNGAIHPVPGPGFLPFAILSTVFSILAIYYLVVKFRRAGELDRPRMKIVLTSMLIMLALIIATILVPILFFAAGTFVILTPIYTLIFLGATGYAIVKYGLFDVKIVATEGLAATIWMILFAEVIASNTLIETVANSFVLLTTIILGIMLVKSVRKEVEQREKLQELDGKLEAANTQLEELSHFKSQLLSLASHQIRSPLAAIKGFGTLITDGSYGPVSDPVKETVEKMKQSTDELLGLINTLLDLRKVDEGKMDYQFAPTDLIGIARSVVNLMKPLADQKKMELTLTAPEGEILVNADATKLKQVVQNLVDNAIKYTPSGFVRVELKQENGKVIVLVADSGLGIPVTLIPHLFEEFIRDQRVKEQIRGTGLGLYIARKITEAHGGTLSATSEGEVKGSTFKIELPAMK